VLVFLAASLAIVPRGYAGVVYDLDGGIQEQELPEGLNFVVPFKQHVTNVDVRFKAWVFNDETVFVHTADLHEVRVPFAINYRVNPEKASQVLQTVAGDPAEVILSHAALNSMRTEVGSIRLDDLAQNVTAVAQAVEATIGPQAERNGLEIQYIAIEDSVIDAAYIEAVKQERISERNIKTEQNKAVAATHTAEQVRVLAQGDADAIGILAQAREEEQSLLGLSPTQYVWYSRWDGVLPRTLLSEDSANLILDLPSED
jgi:prohibitin 1